MERKEFLYIYKKNNIHNWGIVLESVDEEKIKKFTRLLLPNGIKDSACIAEKYVYLQMRWMTLILSFLMCLE